MHRRKLMIIGALELYALCLALLAYRLGLHTDEAKYLLSIPYPHPPAIRSLLSLGLALPFHEFLMRFLVASAAVQCVWFLRDIGVVLPGRWREVALTGTWLLSPALILQGGTVMLATITALFGLMAVWLALSAESPKHCHGACIGLLWFLALFGAYQSLLFAPLVWRALKRGGQRTLHAVLYLGVPIGLLVLYSLGHPLAVASMLKVTTQDAPLPIGGRLWSWIVILNLAGGTVTSIAGLWGILTGGNRYLLWTLAIILAYIALTAQHYYAILLSPLLVGGVFLLLKHRRLPPGSFLVLQCAATLITLIMAFPAHSPNLARLTILALEQRGITGTILIDGPYGHEWQYESRQPIRTFTQELKSSIEDTAAVFLCTKTDCSEDVDPMKWQKLDGLPVAGWRRR